MPPLPSLLDSETVDLIASLRRRQTDLLEYQIPRLRSCNESLRVQQDLAAELQEDIEVLARQIEELEISVEDQRTDSGRTELRRIVDEFVESLSSIRKESRTALLASKRAIGAQGHSDRAELFRSATPGEKQTFNEKVADDALMKANNDVTVALQRTIGLMQKELEQSVLSAQILESSTATLSSASTTHDVLTGLLGTSKQLITSLENTDWLDRLIIIFALVFFFLVVLFILKKRIIDRGIHIAFWWTRFIPFGISSRQVSEKGAVLASSISTVASSAALLPTSSIATSIADQAAASSWTQIIESEPALSTAVRDAYETLTSLSETLPTAVVHPEL